MTLQGKITEEELARVRGRIGVWRTFPWAFNEVATTDAMRHYAYGIGDDNPLWWNQEYGRKTKYRGAIAFPTFVESCGGGSMASTPGMPGVHGIMTDHSWSFYRPVRVGEKISHTYCLTDVYEKRSTFSGRAVYMITETKYANEDGELVAKLVVTMMRMERGMAKQEGKYSGLTKYHYTLDEIAAIKELVLKERRRGPGLCYWENVQIGDELPTLIKGPLTITDEIAFLMGWGSAYVRAHRVGALFAHEHPGITIPNSLGVPDVPERIHWEDELVHSMGLHAPFDYAPQRVAWLAHVLTDWMGDDGWLKVLPVRFLRFNHIGDTQWCKGRVVDKYVKGGEHIVICDLWAENQRGEVTTRSSGAQVILSSQIQGPMVLTAAENE